MTFANCSRICRFQSHLHVAIAFANGNRINWGSQSHLHIAVVRYVYIAIAFARCNRICTSRSHLTNAIAMRKRIFKPQPHLQIIISVNFAIGYSHLQIAIAFAFANRIAFELCNAVMISEPERDRVSGYECGYKGCGISVFFGHGFSGWLRP